MWLRARFRVHVQRVYICARSGTGRIRPLADSKQATEKRSAAQAEYDRLGGAGQSPRFLKSPRPDRMSHRNFWQSPPKRVRFIGTGPSVFPSRLGPFLLGAIFLARCRDRLAARLTLVCGSFVRPRTAPGYWRPSGIFLSSARRSGSRLKSLPRGQYLRPGRIRPLAESKQATMAGGTGVGHE